MNKKNIFSALLLLFFGMAAVMISCTHEDDAISTGVSDFNSKISSLSNDAPGQGAPLTITGSDLDGVIRIAVGNVVVPQRNFIEQTESSITFNVPSSAALGANEMMVVWSGPGRAFRDVTVVKFHTFSFFSPPTAAEDQIVILRGNNLDLVEDVKVGDVQAVIVSQSVDKLEFAMPAGAPTDKIVVSSPAGDFKSATDLISCDADPSDYGCLPVVNTNGSFEDGSAGVNVSVPGWGGIVGGNVTAEVTTADSFEGSQCVKMNINSVGANPWNIQPNSSFPVDPTATYHLSIWVKGTGIAKIKFPVDGGGSPNYNEVGGSTEMALSTEQWTEIKYDFSPSGEAAGDQMSRFAISISYPGNTGGVFYMDNLRIVKIPN